MNPPNGVLERSTYVFFMTLDHMQHRRSVSITAQEGEARRQGLRVELEAFSGL